MKVKATSWAMYVKTKLSVVACAFLNLLLSHQKNWPFIYPLLFYLLWERDWTMSAMFALLLLSFASLMVVTMWWWTLAFGLWLSFLFNFFQCIRDWSWMFELFMMSVRLDVDIVSFRSCFNWYCRLEILDDFVQDLHIAVYKYCSGLGS